MIYYIVGSDKHSNEWVISSHDSADEATKAIEKYRRSQSESPHTYRIDIVDRSNLREISLKFTALELFPPANGATTSDCVECGCYVRIPKQTKHAEWHNKVADL